MNNMTDFNDLHQLAGPDAVKECIDTAISSCLRRILGLQATRHMAGAEGG